MAASRLTSEPLEGILVVTLLCNRLGGSRAQHQHHQSDAWRAAHSGLCADIFGDKNKIGRVSHIALDLSSLGKCTGDIVIGATPGRDTRETQADGSPNLLLIVGCIAGISLFLLITCVAIYIYYIRRSSRSSQPAQFHPYGFGDGISYRDLPSGKASSIDSWRQKANNIPPTPSSGSLTSSSLSGSRLYVPHVQPVGRLNAASPGRSPPPEYPDYLPYTGPVEPRPSESMTLEPPRIAGIDASTQGWLTATAAALSPLPSASWSKPTRQIHRPEPIPLRNRLSSAMTTDLLDSYYPQQDLISSASTFSSLGLTGTGLTIRAMGATRSVARIWPNNVVVDPYRPVQESHSAPSTSLTQPVSRPGSPPSRGTHTPSTLDSALSSAYPKPSPHASATTSGFSGGTSAATFSPESGSIASSYPLRRGVSIKSVKTMRSFFSALLFSSPMSDTPALPRRSERYEYARPDSDIFPIASLSRSGSLVRPGPRPEGLSDLGHCVIGDHSIRSGGNTALLAGGGAFTPNSDSAATIWSSENCLGAKQREVQLERASSATSHTLPPIRLDRGEDNFFIELNPNSPVTMVGGSRPGSEQTAVPTWRIV